MSDQLELYCLVLGDGPSHIFPVKIAGTESVGTLKEVIKAKKPHRFQHLDADSLVLLQVSISANSDEELQEKLRLRNKDLDVSLSSWKRLAEFFSGLGGEALHVVIQAPTVPPLHQLGTKRQLSLEPEEKNEPFQKYLRTLNAKRPSPSQNARSTNYCKTQTGDTVILDGRYDPATPTPTVAPPIQLYHPVFAKFLSEMHDTDNLPDDLIDRTGQLMRSASGIATAETPRQLPTRMHLSEILTRPLNQGINPDRSSSDHIILHQRKESPIQTAALAIVEEKSGGCDVSIQGGCSYLSFWRSEDHAQLRELGVCPAFIICLAGPWLAIMGAVLPSQPIVQRLTDFIWIGTSPVLTDARCLRVAAVLRALKESLNALDNYYDALQYHPLTTPRPSEHPRFFPFPSSYNVASETIKFRYLKPLDSSDPACVTYLAQNIQDEQLIVVKFAQTYGEQAHRLLAQQQMAPQLYYCGRVGEDAGYDNLKLVVMEYVKGETAADRYHDQPLPTNVIEQLSAALDILHSHNLVFGDLRKPNIMIRSDNVTQLVDFDWSGVHDQARYPVHLSRDVKWPEGVDSYRTLSKQHDRDMLTLLQY